MWCMDNFNAAELQPFGLETRQYFSCAKPVFQKDENIFPGQGIS